MSKAFTRETDAAPDDDEDELRLPDLPAGGTNYITAGGFGRLRGELLNRHDAPLICGVQVQLGALRKLALSRDPTGARPPIWRGWRMNPNAGALSRIERLAACSVMPSDAFLAIRNREGGAEVRIPLPEIIDFVARYPG